MLDKLLRNPGSGIGFVIATLICSLSVWGASNSYTAYINLAQILQAPPSMLNRKGIFMLQLMRALDSFLLAVLVMFAVATLIWALGSAIFWLTATRKSQ